MKKSKTRIFVDQKITANLIIYIKNKQHHYLKNVMRVKINDLINIFDAISGEWEAKIASINRDNIVLRVIKKKNLLIKSKDIWLVFSPIKSQRMNIAIQKATELGISKIIPCETRHSNIKNINIKSLRDNTIEAAEQSERLDIPTIEKICNLNELIANWPKDRKLIFCDETIKENQFIIETLLSLRNVENKFAILIGPEGGFSSEERDLIKGEKNVISVSLGDTILRSDTAITVALYCLRELT